MSASASASFSGGALIPVLDKDNYAIWVIRMRGMLEEAGVYYVVENGLATAPPALANDATPAQHAAHASQRARVAADNTANLKARNIILRYVSDQHARSVASAATAQEAWEQLAAEFVQVSIARQSQLQMQLSQLRMQADETVAGFFARTMLLRDELTSAGCPPSDHSLLLAVLNAMPPEFKIAVQLLRYQLTVGNADLDVVKKYCNYPGHVLSECRRYARDHGSFARPASPSLAQAQLSPSQPRGNSPSRGRGEDAGSRSADAAGSSMQQQSDAEQANVLFMARTNRFPMLSRTDPVATPLPGHLVPDNMTDEEFLDFYARLPRWVIDSGANRHIMPWRSCLSDYHTFDPPIQLQLGGTGTSIDVLGEGTTYLTNSEVKRAAFAEAASSTAICPGCAMGKQHRRVRFDLSTNAPPVTAALGLVHMDVCGPMPHAGRDGSRYIATFLDEHTGLSVIQLLTSKDQVPTAVQRVITELETQSGQRCKALRSDNGSEYSNKTMSGWCSSKGIQQQFSAPYCPEHNGKAERQPVTPWEAFYHRKPNLSALRVFGATAWVYVTQPNRNKLQPKAVKGIFVGYAVGSKAYKLDMPSSDTPTVLEALSGPQADYWREAMHTELASLHAIGTWTLVERPPGARVLPTKWVLKIKRDATGAIEKFKARLVAKGFMQVSSVDVGDVYAPVSKHTTLRALLALAVARDMEVHQIDVEAAFLNGTLQPDEVIHIQQPEGFEEGSRNTVCRLQKALYGLRQAPRAWHAKLKQELEGMGFCASESDPALFMLPRPSGTVYLLVYVDDCLLCTEKGDFDSLDFVKQRLSSVFGIKDLGQTRWFLGMQISRNRAQGTLQLDQQQYIKELLSTYSMTEAHSKAVPMAPGTKLVKEGDALDTAHHSYSALVAPGALNPGRLGRRNPRLSQAKWSARHMSSMSVDGSSYAADAAGSVNGPTIGSRFSPSAPPVKHPLPSSGTVLLPYELDRSFQCVQSSLQVLCNDAELWGGSALQLVLRKLPSRASAAFSDGFVKPSVVQEYQRRYEELPSDQAWDADYCIAMFLDIVRDDLSDPVLLKQHVQGVQLGDVGDSGRTEAPRSLKARMAPQLVRMAEEGHLSRLCAVNLFLHALMPHPRHVLHSQGQHLVQRSKVTYARLPKPPHSQDSVELALGRAEAAATQVYEELIGMLQLEQAAGKPLNAPAGVNAAELLGQKKKKKKEEEDYSGVEPACIKEGASAWGAACSHHLPWVMERPFLAPIPFPCSESVACFGDAM
ncbi:hypothetical protein QJQ45_012940 [Haematococcus lacustris]|nr:hypothetical protein QJQ45_012940 [Haematococcus lacustris]